MKLVFNKNNGKIIAQIPNDQDASFVFQKKPQEFIASLDSLIVDANNLTDLKHYYIKDYNVVKYSTEEISEIDNYGKILSEEEKEQLIQKSEQEEKKQVEKIATESFAKLSFKMMAPTLTTTQVLQFEPLVEDWLPGIFIIGDIRKHLGQVWKCVQGHNNTNNPDIEPGKSAAQWSPYHSKDMKYVKPYIQPQGAHDAYMVGEYCIFENKTYKSKITSNVWTPIGYPQGWEMII